MVFPSDKSSRGDRIDPQAPRAGAELQQPGSCLVPDRPAPVPVTDTPGSLARKVGVCGVHQARGLVGSLAGDKKETKGQHLARPLEWLWSRCGHTWASRSRGRAALPASRPGRTESTHQHAWSPGISRSPEICTDGVYSPTREAPGFPWLCRLILVADTGLGPSCKCTDPVVLTLPTRFHSCLDGPEALPTPGL